MLKCPYTTLRILKLQDNLIRRQGSEQLKKALELNKKIIKLLIDHNPIKSDVIE